LISDVAIFLSISLANSLIGTDAGGAPGIWACPQASANIAFSTGKTLYHQVDPALPTSLPSWSTSAMF